MATGAFTNTELSAQEIYNNAPKNIHKRSNISTGTNFANYIAFLLFMGCVRFAW